MSGLAHALFARLAPENAGKPSGQTVSETPTHPSGLFAKALQALKPEGSLAQDPLAEHEIPDDNANVLLAAHTSQQGFEPGQVTLNISDIQSEGLHIETAQASDGPILGSSDTTPEVELSLASASMTHNRMAQPGRTLPSNSQVQQISLPETIEPTLLPTVDPHAANTTLSDLPLTQILTPNVAEDMAQAPRIADKPAVHISLDALDIGLQNHSPAGSTPLLDKTGILSDIADDHAAIAFNEATPGLETIEHNDPELAVEEPLRFVEKDIARINNAKETDPLVAQEIHPSETVRVSGEETELPAVPHVAIASNAPPNSDTVGATIAQRDETNIRFVSDRPAATPPSNIAVSDDALALTSDVEGNPTVPKGTVTTETVTLLKTQAPQQTEANILAQPTVALKPVQVQAQSEPATLPLPKPVPDGADPSNINTNGNETRFRSEHQGVYSDTSQSTVQPSEPRTGPQHNPLGLDNAQISPSEPSIPPKTDTHLRDVTQTGPADKSVRTSDVRTLTASETAAEPARPESARIAETSVSAVQTITSDSSRISTSPQITLQASPSPVPVSGLSERLVASFVQTLNTPNMPVTLDRLPQTVVAIALTQQRATIQIDPPELGRIQVDYQFDSQNRTIITLVPETEAARAALTDRIATITATLQQNSQIPVDVNIGSAEDFSAQDGQAFSADTSDSSDGEPTQPQSGQSEAVQDIAPSTLTLAQSYGLTTERLHIRV